MLKRLAIWGCMVGSALTLASCSVQNDSPGPRATPDGNLRYGTLTFKPCALGTARARAVEAHCSTLSVPENHDEPNGRKIDLAIAVVLAEGQATADPVIVITGGPGQSALETYPLVNDAFTDILRSRHVLLVDARGTGGSHPLKCSNKEGESSVMEEADDTAEVARAFAERCRDELSKTSDLRYYATGDHIRDLDLVRQQLGVESLNLYGVSYGTRVAQQYARRYPQHTRTVTLDGVVPNTLVLGQEHGRNLDSALAQQFKRCREDAACTRNLGDPAAKLAALRTRLLAGGLPKVQYRDPITGEWRSDAPSYGHLVALMRLYAYQPQAASLLPLVVHHASDGHYGTLIAQARTILADVSEQIMHGMQLSVMCTDDPELAPNPADADTVMGATLVDFMVAQCAIWPKGVRAAGFREPLSGDAAVLAISGELDPVTPPRYGDEIVKSLPNGRHLTLPGQGHGVIGVGCMPKLFTQFIETADAKALDASCLERLSATAPFAGDYGWEP